MASRAVRFASRLMSARKGALLLLLQACLAVCARGSLLGRRSLAAQAPRCDWKAPVEGRWGYNKPPGEAWQPFEDHCKTEYLIDNAVLGKPPFSESHGILFFGDSIDAFNMYELCDRVNSTNWSPGTYNKPPGDGKYNHDYNKLNYCVTPTGFRVGEFFLCGLNYDGPYWQGETLKPNERIEAAAKEWKERFQDAPLPSTLVFSSNLWDVAGAHLRGELAFSPHHANDPAYRLFPDELLSSWMANLTRLVAQVQQVFPKDSTLVFKTTALPMRHNVAAGQDLPQHFSRMAVKQLNAAGRAVARSLGLLLLDAEVMASWLPHQIYLRDGSHPSTMFALEVDNLLLNMMRDELQARS